MENSQYKMNLIKIGLKIAYYRKLQGMTQEELAEACELSSGYISQLEAPNCFFCPSLKTLFRIAEVLSTTVSKLTDIEDLFFTRMRVAQVQKNLSYPRMR